MDFAMSKVIKFPIDKEEYILKRQYCECGGVLEMWVDNDNTAYGLCTRCHLGVGDELVKIADEDDGETRH